MKKITILVLSLMLLVMPALAAAPAQAGEGTEKLYYELNVDIYTYTACNVRTAPPESATPNVRFLDLVEDISEDFSLQIGNDVYYPSRSSEVEVIMPLHQSFVLTKFEETYTFEGIEGTIVVTGTGRVNNYYTDDAMSDVNVVGYGTGYFDGIKIKAEGSNEVGNAVHKIHIGTIMGWPGLP